MTSPTVLACALGSTTFAAAATALKHRSASTLGPRTGSRWRHVLAGATDPRWLLALTADGAALALQVIALHIGTLTVVQPLLISALLFSLLLHHQFERTRPDRREVLLAAAVLLSLAAFLAVSGSAVASTAPAQPADRAVGVAVAVTAAVVFAGLLIAAKLQRRANRALLLGTAVAIVYATTAALIKACTNIFSTRPSDLPQSWQLYALLVTGLTGLLLTQLAFRAAPLTASLPAIAGLDPILSVVLGVLVFDEPLRSGPLATSGELAALLGLAASAYALSRVEARPPAPTTAPGPAYHSALR